MGDLEFQRELSPDQIHEALSLLDKAAHADNQNLKVGDLNPAQRDGEQDRPPAPEDPQPRRKHPHLALACCGLGIAVATALPLLFWSEGVLTRPSPPIAREQLSIQPASQLVKRVSPSVPAANPTPDPGGSAQPALKPEIADPSPVGRTNRGNQVAVTDAADSPRSYSSRVIPNAAQAATVAAIATREAWWDEHARRKLKEAWRARVAKKRFRRRHWQARVEIGGRGCVFFTCVLPRVVYVPVR